MPPAWSDWSWVTTAAASRSTPSRSSLAAQLVAGRPAVDEHRLAAAGSSRIASPWPTSRTVTRSPGAGAAGASDAPRPGRRDGDDRERSDRGSGEAA